MSNFTNLTNHFLIAMPALNDPNFYRAVTYICEHSEEGAVGIIINHPLNIPLTHALDQMQIDTTNLNTDNIPIYFGGPIQPDRGFVIHPSGKKWRSTLEANNKIAITTSQDILHAIAVGEGPDDVIVALGYAGWESKQLEEELSQNFWLSVEADPAILFNTPYDKRWDKAAALIGIDINSLSSDIGHA